MSPPESESESSNWIGAEGFYNKFVVKPGNINLLMYKDFYSNFPVEMERILCMIKEEHKNFIFKMVNGVS